MPKKPAFPAASTGPPERPGALPPRGLPTLVARAPAEPIREAME